jgi:hypothetical protein
MLFSFVLGVGLIVVAVVATPFALIPFATGIAALFSAIRPLLTARAAGRAAPGR